MLDLYFKKPIFWDYFLCMIFCAISICLVKKNIIILPSKEETISITSDITNISLTLAGFILTIFTLFLTKYCNFVTLFFAHSSLFYKCSAWAYYIP